MHTVLKLTAIAASLTSLAASTLADQTNLVQTLNVQLVAFSQGGTRTNRSIVTTSVDTMRIDTRDVINALGTATAQTFSRNARLVMISPLPAGAPKFEVRDGASKVDVTPLLGEQTVSGPVSSLRLNTANGRATSADYTIERLMLLDGEGFLPLPLHFDLNGISAEDITIVPGQRTRDNLTAEISGSGDAGGTALILGGSMTIRGSALEVQAGGGAPGV